MQDTWYSAMRDGWLIRILIQPQASRSAIVGLHGDRLKIRISAPPVDGKANQELIDFLSEQLEVPKSSISILRGLTHRQKDLSLPSSIPETRLRSLEMT